MQSIKLDINEFSSNKCHYLNEGTCTVYGETVLFQVCIGICGLKISI